MAEATYRRLKRRLDDVKLRMCDGAGGILERAVHFLCTEIDRVDKENAELRRRIDALEGKVVR